MYALGKSTPEMTIVSYTFNHIGNAHYLVADKKVFIERHNTFIDYSIKRLIHFIWRCKSMTASRNQLV